MYVAPNTNVRILKNVPLDNTYRNTIFFLDRGSQVAYFSGKTKYNLTQLSYQAPWGKPLRVEVNAENLYDCNYIMFQNTSFGTKWFYAFITNVESQSKLMLCRPGILTTRLINVLLSVRWQLQTTLAVI